MAEKKPKTEREAREKPERMKPLSMNGLSIEEALRGAMEVPPPENERGEPKDDPKKDE